MIMERGGGQEEAAHDAGVSADLIFALQCLKNCRNLGIMMLRGLFRASLSSSSDESSQIFCSAPKAPWRSKVCILISITPIALVNSSFF